MYTQAKLRAIFSVVNLARQEIAQLGLVRPEEIEDGAVVRMPKAYPLYQESYTEQVNVIRHYVEQNLTNLQLVGRNGMHKYNNQDHSMMTALGAARRVLIRGMLLDSSLLGLAGALGGILAGTRFLGLAHSHYCCVSQEPLQSRSRGTGMLPSRLRLDRFRGARDL